MRSTCLLFIILIFFITIIAQAGSIPQTDSTNKPAPAATAPDTTVTSQNQLPIDTALNKSVQKTVIPDNAIVDSVRKADSLLAVNEPEKILTNTKLFIYILLSVLGLGLFFFIFVINLFKTFHKKKSTRQSLLLSWSLFFTIAIIWIFIVWGLVAGFWTNASFMIVTIFLFIISLIMTIIAIKSK